MALRNYETLAGRRVQGAGRMEQEQGENLDFT
jgi:hypothetical protein